MKQIMVVVIEIEGNSTHSVKNIEESLNFYWGSNGKFKVSEINGQSVWSIIMGQIAPNRLGEDEDRSAPGGIEFGKVESTELAARELGSSPLEGLVSFSDAYEEMSRRISSAYGLPPGEIIGIDRAAPGSKDQTVYSPAPKDVEEKSK